MPAARREPRRRTPVEPVTVAVEVMGLEPTDLLHAMQALYQLSYTPAAPPQYQGAFPVLARPSPGRRPRPPSYD